MGNETLKENFSSSSIPVRLQVFLAHAGVASRRAAEDLIARGRVSVNGVTISEMGFKVLPKDTVMVDGRPVETETRFLYLVLNKPPEYICASADPQGRPLALDLLPAVKERLYNVGRLDYLSSGLVLFTNDGRFAARVGHPSSGIEKEYLVESSVPIPERAIEEFGRGVVIDGILYRAHKIEKTGRSSARVILLEGKNREIRRVFSHFHLHPSKLQRIRIGPVKIGDLAEGGSRPLTGAEIDELFRGA
ncbi:MAG: rRNA pseudouridine synthase [Treponema sp.]|jgi:23S rRNA pseudouridine2605 synthase|nr:rRNA pseudouridine synthase [Treponema sp.]